MAGWSAALITTLTTAVVATTATPAWPVGATSALFSARDFAYPSGINEPTADKPQSKLWYHGGSWWGLLVSPDGSGVHVFELTASHAWRDTGVVVDPRPNSTGDALADGDRLYVASRTGSGNVIVNRLDYNPSARSYRPNPAFPTTLATGGSESATIVKDSLGVLWATFFHGANILVTHSSGDDAHWVAPFQPPGPATFPTDTVDPMASIVAFGNHVGVMWTNPNPGSFRFVTHHDGDPDAQWGPVETALESMGSNDHINLRSIPGDPRVFGAVKTSLHANAAQPRLMLVVRDAAGNWSHTPISTVGDNQSRPQLLLDPVAGRLTAIMSSYRDGNVYAKETSLNSPAFDAGPGTVIIHDTAAINNVSSTRQPVSNATGIVALASVDTTHLYVHAELGSVPHGAGGVFVLGNGVSSGYHLVASDGGVFAFGDAPFLGSTGSLRLNAPIVAMTTSPTGGGYWLVARDGGVFAFGDAPFVGSTGGRGGNAPTVGMAAAASNGYWLADSAGKVAAFGSAPAAGSVGRALNSPVVGIVATPTGSGYWLVARDGGVFTFGDAPFLGSTGALRLNAPIVAMAITPTGRGYWLIAADGGVFAFGDAPFLGSTGGRHINAPVVAVQSGDGAGYRLIARDGGVFAFGDAPFLGSMGGTRLNQPVVGASR